MKSDFLPEVVQSHSDASSTASKRMVLLLAVTLSWMSAFAQSPATTPEASKTSVVPNLVRFSGVATDDGKPLNRILGITFALYQNQEGGAPLWLETQNVQPDENGHYTVSLGATKSQGIPPELFTSGQAQWLGVQIEGQAEQPHALLLSVPYAFKAADAETVGGLPPSAFVLATLATSATIVDSAGNSASSTSRSVMPAASTTGSGTTNFVPLWTSATNLGNSVVFQSGSGSTAKIGVNTTTPATTLDVKGAGTIRGTLVLPATAAATATGGKKSQPLNLSASAFNSGTQAVANETFQWVAEPAGNNTAAPSATLNLLFGAGAAAPSETGVRISNKGVFTFAAGQTFPGAGTIIGVTAGTGLTGGGTTGKVTLNLDTAKIPQLSSANSFTGPQTITNNATADALTINNNFGTGYGVVATGHGGGVLAEAANVGATGVFGANTASTGAGIGVQGFSVAGTGVLGETSGSSGLFNGAAAVVGDTKNYFGVWGLSALNDGVHGINGSGASGVAGENKGGGYGVWAIASNSNTYGVGVRGESFGNSRFPNGNGSDGVDGFAHSENGSGVAGVNFTDGPGVYGHSNGGAGFTTDSNVSQARNMGGWVKAMAYVDPFAPGGVAITRCFNSQVSGPAASTPPCGISIVSHSQGENYLDFAFQVTDRFVNASAAQFSGTIVNAVADGFDGPNVVGVTTYNIFVGEFEDEAFSVFVY